MLKDLLSLNTRVRNRTLCLHIETGVVSYYTYRFLSNTCFSIQQVVKDRTVDFGMVRNIGIHWKFKHSILGDNYAWNNTYSNKRVEKDDPLRDKYFLELIKIHNRLQHAKLTSDLIDH